MEICEVSGEENTDVFLSQCEVIRNISPMSSYWVFVSRMECVVQILIGKYYSARRVVWAGGSWPQFLFCLTSALALCLLHSWAAVTSELSNKNMNLLYIVCPFLLLPWECAMDCLVWTSDSYVFLSPRAQQCAMQLDKALWQFWWARASRDGLWIVSKSLQCK